MPIRAAVITMVYNESFFLPLWCSYYGRELGVENLYIIDHGSTDGCTSCVAGNIIRIPRDHFDDTERAKMISLLHASLLKAFDVVIYTDCDEFLVPDSSQYSSFRDYLAQKNGLDTIRAVGVDVVQENFEKAPIDLTKGILNQRGYGYITSWESKPLISYSPINWIPGFHDCDKHSIVDESLWLFHLKNVDIQHSLKRLKTTREMKWSQHALDTNGGLHQRVSDDFFRENILKIQEEKTEEYIDSCNIMDMLCNFKIGNLRRIPDKFKTF
ncbi:glycosyltransferase family 2 protein [Acetobacter sp. P5B1]|uniref:glycosyltransferase family 2 protein n=1 Tax=Acetobacter sp. P5B1 TaxID=2762620 RepID=UPI001C05C654|nr:glycosyltransferase family 2 protein [Acetobacter sp. P5B1]